MGSRFATDQELCRRFGVSRHTVREALRVLQDGGLLIRQRGSGTVVAAATPAPKIYSQTFQSLDQLDAYAKDVRFEKRSETVVVLQRKLAELLDCPLNSKWLHIVGLRWLVESSHPLGWSEIFIAEPFIGVRDQTSDGFMAYYEKLRRAFGLAAKRVDLRVSAVGVPRKVASALGVKAGTPALLVRRQYFADGDVPFVSDTSNGTSPSATCHLKCHLQMARRRRRSIGAEPVTPAFQP